MGAEVIVLHYAAPVGIDHPFAVLLGPDAVHPVIFVGEAAARPAEHRNPDLFKRIHNVIANPVRIRNLGIHAYPDSLVNTTSQMLGEMPVNIPVNRSFADVGVKHTLQSHEYNISLINIFIN
ncbi:hypothetical protein D3C72_1943910 [compost metagenome]